MGTDMPASDRIFTPYGDLWYVRDDEGRLVPRYSNILAERAAIEAFHNEDYGSLTTVEIEYFSELTN